MEKAVLRDCLFLFEDGKYTPVDSCCNRVKIFCRIIIKSLSFTIFTQQSIRFDEIAISQRINLFHAFQG